MSDDRDTLVRKTPPAGVRAQTASPEVEVFEDCTGKYEGEELAQARAKRPTAERLAKLEIKHDALAEDVTKTRIDVGEIRGQLNGQDAVLDEIRGTVRLALARDGRDFEAHLDIRTAKAKAEIGVQADARKGWRKLVLRLLGVVGALVIGAAIHWLLGML